MLVGLGHLDLVCRDLDASLRFYAAVFGPLGLEPPHLVPGERGEQIHYLRFPQAGSGSLGLRQALVDQEFELYAPGLHHFAFAVESREEVDGVHRDLGIGLRTRAGGVARDRNQQPPAANGRGTA